MASHLLQHLRTDPLPVWKIIGRENEGARKRAGKDERWETRVRGDEETGRGEIKVPVFHHEKQNKKTHFPSHSQTIVQRHSALLQIQVPQTLSLVLRYSFLTVFIL
jgi:hypothetical protein